MGRMDELKRRLELEMKTKKDGALCKSQRTRYASCFLGSQRPPHHPLMVRQYAVTLRLTRIYIPPRSYSQTAQLHSGQKKQGHRSTSNSMSLRFREQSFGP